MAAWAERLLVVSKQKFSVPFEKAKNDFVASGPPQLLGRNGLVDQGTTAIRQPQSTKLKLRDGLCEQQWPRDDLFRRDAQAAQSSAIRLA